MVLYEVVVWADVENVEILGYLKNRRLFMENKDQEKKTDEVSEKSKKETIEEREKEEREKQNARLAERKGQRKAFPFKRGGL